MLVIMIIIYDYNYSELHSSRRVTIKMLLLAKRVTIKMLLQWNPSKVDAVGTKGFVLYSEVSFAQGLRAKCPRTHPLCFVYDLGDQR